MGQVAGGRARSARSSAAWTPDRRHQVRTLRVVRRQVTDQAAIPLSRPPRALVTALHEIRERLLSPRRLRSSPRVINRKMSNWKLKHTEHHNPPAPTPARALRPAGTHSANRSRALAGQGLPETFRAGTGPVPAWWVVECGERAGAV